MTWPEAWPHLREFPQSLMRVQQCHWSVRLILVVLNTKFTPSMFHTALRGETRGVRHADTPRSLSPREPVNFMEMDRPLGPRLHSDLTRLKVLRSSRGSESRTRSEAVSQITVIPLR